ncbi:hypothetical protein NKG94_02815 [Micromonospora sp. M12]
MEDRPASIQSCEIRGDVTYCFFEGFGGFVPGWDAVVTSVRAVVPASAASSVPPLAVRQRTSFDAITAGAGPGRPPQTGGWPVGRSRTRRRAPGGGPGRHRLG